MLNLVSENIWNHILTFLPEEIHILFQRFPINKFFWKNELKSKVKPVKVTFLEMIIWEDSIDLFLNIRCIWQEVHLLSHLVRVATLGKKKNILCHLIQFLGTTDLERMFCWSGKTGDWDFFLQSEQWWEKNAQTQDKDQIFLNALVESFHGGNLQIVLYLLSKMKKESWNHQHQTMTLEIAMHAEHIPILNFFKQESILLVTDKLLECLIGGRTKVVEWFLENSLNNKHQFLVQEMSRQHRIEILKGDSVEMFCWLRSFDPNYWKLTWDDFLMIIDFNCLRLFDFCVSDRHPDHHSNPLQEMNRDIYAKDQRNFFFQKINDPTICLHFIQHDRFLTIDYAWIYLQVINEMTIPFLNFLHDSFDIRFFIKKFSPWNCLRLILFKSESVVYQWLKVHDCLNPQEISSLMFYPMDRNDKDHDDDDDETDHWPLPPLEWKFCYWAFQNGILSGSLFIQCFREFFSSRWDITYNSTILINAGCFDIFQYCRTMFPEKYPWDISILRGAVAANRLDILEWCRNQTPPCPWDETVTDEALQRNYWHIFIWSQLQDPPCPCRYRIGDEFDLVQLASRFVTDDNVRFLNQCFHLPFPIPKFSPKRWFTLYPS